MHHAADFQLDDGDLQRRLDRARERPASGRLDRVLRHAREGRGLDADEMALLWYAPEVDADALYQLALARRRERPEPLETFSPLYLTNTCDAECRMCGMRRDNAALERETVDSDAIEAQLRILRGRGMLGVSLLTGEYRAGNRAWAMRYVNDAVRRADRLGFRHVLLNIGSIDDDEFDALLAGIPRHADGSVRTKMTMCTFQETYCRRHYAKFMGTDPANPRADYQRRLANFDRSFRAGLRVANPGILLGLNPDLGFELIAMALHAQHLLRLGMEVYLSVPRLRQIAGRGGHHSRGASDDDFIRAVALLAVGLPACKIVLTTREPAAIQHRLVPIVGVLSAGSAAVAPYTSTGARFPLASSQFEVIDQRPFEQVLGEFLTGGATIENFQPAAG